MKIKRIEGKNFKSFSEFRIDLEDFNVIIGSNASGKSNLIESLRFLKNIYNHGIRTAIDFQGDVNNLLNRNSGNSRKIWLRFTFESEFGIPSLGHLEIFKSFFPEQKGEDAYTEENAFLGLYVTEIVYTLEISVSRDRREIKNIDEKIDLVGYFDKFHKIENEDPYKFYDTDIFGNAPGAISIYPKDNELKIKYPSISLIGEDDDWGPYFGEPWDKEEAIKIFKTAWNNKERVLFHPMLLQFVSAKYSESQNLLRTVDNLLIPNLGLDSILTFDLHPRAMKKGSLIYSKNMLEEEGGNLPQVLHRILKNEETKKRFLNLLSYALPYVRDLKISVMEDRSNITMISESYHKGKDLAAAYMSDGTLVTIAMVTALFFSEGNIVIIEEPERNLHPKIIPQIVELMNEAARERQIIITTHNPEFVKWASLDKLLLVYRNENGSSTAIRPKDVEFVKNFIANEIGIDEIFVNNKFGV